MSIRLDSPIKSKVLVTGEAGFISSLLIEKLLLDGRFVVSLDNLSNVLLKNLSIAISSENFEFRKMDCTDIVTISSVMKIVNLEFQSWFQLLEVLNDTLNWHRINYRFADYT